MGQAVRAGERQSEWRLVLMDALPGMVWSAGAENARDDFNRRWLAFRGRSLDQETGRGWMEGVHPEDLRELENLQQESLARQVSFQAEYRLRRHDGVYRWMLDAGEPRFSPAGEYLAFIGSCVDIDDRRAGQERLREDNQRLRRQNEELNEFACTLSHDMQEPLRTISLYAELLARRVGTEHGVDPGVPIAAIQAGTLRLQALIQGLFHYSYLGHHAEPEWTDVDSNALLAQVLLSCEAAIQESHAVVTCGPLPAVRADPGQLAHLLQNLVSNAIKYRRPEEPPRIHITAVTGPLEWVFEVADNGMGFDACYAEQIFEPLKRLHGGEPAPGAGLGLALCRRIVERHGGRIWARSIPGRGSRFTFTLMRS